MEWVIFSIPTATGVEYKATCRADKCSVNTLSSVCDRIIPGDTLYDALRNHLLYGHVEYPTRAVYTSEVAATTDVPLTPREKLVKYIKEANTGIHQKLDIRNKIGIKSPTEFKALILVVIEEEYFKGKKIVDTQKFILITK